MDICKSVNHVPHLSAVPGSFDSVKTREYSTLNPETWDVDHPVVVVHVEDCVVGDRAIKYCSQTAQVTLKHLEVPCVKTDGSRIMVNTPYNAHEFLFVRMCDSRVLKATSQGKLKLAESLKKIEVMTIDSSMGQDRSLVIVDRAGHQGCIMESPRTPVALTRAEVSMVMVLTNLALTAPEVVVKAGKKHSLIGSFDNRTKSSILAR